MFHRAIGKVMFPVLVIVFLLLSIQNTWAFLQEAMPGDTIVYKALAMVVFEGGFIGWLSLTMHGAENVLRTILAALMTLITGAGVFTAAFFEIGKQMQGIGFTLSPQFLSWVPIVVLGSFIATGATLALYMLCSPEFFARMSHMNQTGVEPPIGARIEMLPPRTSAPNRTQIAAPRANQLALPQPTTRANTGHLQVQGGGVMNRLGNWFAQSLGGVQYDASAQEEVDEPESIDDAVETKKEVEIPTSPLAEKETDKIPVKKNTGEYVVNRPAAKIPLND